MVSARAKGARFEREFKEVLESQGYIVERVKGGTKWSKQVDLFSVADLLGFNNHEWLFVQVKTDKNHYSRQPYIKWWEAHLPPCSRFIIAERQQGHLKKGQDRWRIIEIGNNTTN